MNKDLKDEYVLEENNMENPFGLFIGMRNALLIEIAVAVIIYLGYLLFI